MIKVGEKLNSSVPRTREALERRDESYIVDLARKQLDAGADLLDVNASVFMAGERETLLWMIGRCAKGDGVQADARLAEPRSPCRSAGGGRGWRLNP